MAIDIIRKTTAPYLSFHLFQSALKDLKLRDLPDGIKRERFSSISKYSLVQAQILNAFKFFDLVNQYAEPKYLLIDFVKKPEHFSEAVFYETLINSRYGSILDGEDRELMTYAKLDRKFSDPYYGVSGGTKDAAIKFYLKLMEAAEKPLPSHLTKKRGRPSHESQSLGDSDEEISDHSEPGLTLKAARNAANELRRDGGRRGSHRRQVDDGSELDGSDHNLGTRTPIPLGPGRLAYIELPSDWSNRELKRLIRILELTFGDESEIM